MREGESAFEFEGLEFGVVFVFDDVFGEVLGGEEERESVVVEAHLF